MGRRHALLVVFDFLKDKQFKQRLARIEGNIVKIFQKAIGVENYALSRILLESIDRIDFDIE
jgi:hypothetical protein